MADLQHYYNIVEKGIAKIGLDPDKFKGQQEGEWVLMRGEQGIWVDLWHQDELTYLQVSALIMDLPDEIGAAFYKELLEINFSLCGAAFGVHNGNVALVGTRPAQGLDVEEVYAIILLVGKYASEFKPRLMKKYLNNGGPGLPPKG